MDAAGWAGVKSILVPALLAIVAISGCLENESQEPLAAPSPAAPKTGVLEHSVIDLNGVIPASIYYGFQCGLFYDESFPWVLGDNRNATSQAVTNISMTLHVPLMASGVNADTDAFLYDPNGDLVNHTAAFNPTAGETISFHDKGTYAPGTYEIRVIGCVAVQGEWSVHAEADIVATDSNSGPDWAEPAP